MEFYYFCKKSEQGLNRFMRGDNTNNLTDLLRKKMALCDYKIFLISDEQPLQSKLAGFEYLGLQVLFTTWRAIRGEGLMNMDVQEAGWINIENLGIPFYNDGKKTSIVWQFRSKHAQDAFFILLTGAERDGLPRYELLFLSNLWQLMNGSLPIHCSGVVHKDKLFLFAGCSGTGKSTIAQFGSDLGDQVLDDDQILAHVLSNGSFSGDGWGFGIVPYDKPIRAIFKIVQDTTDWMVPLQQSEVAQFIMERSNEIFGNRFPDEGLKRLFVIASAIARQVPSYELHFRKSPDFWKLIDEKFPD